MSDGRRHRQTEGDDGVRPRPRARLSGIGGRDDKLLPEAIRVLARELAREGVEVAHALHRHQERFIGGEPRVDQRRDLLAQVVFQFRDVDGVDRLPAVEIAPPLVDLLLERYRVIRSPASVRLPAAVARLTPGGWRTARESACQMPRSVVVHRLPLPAFLGELRPAPGVIR